MKILAIIAVVLTYLAQPAMAAEWPQPNAAYSAQRVMDGDGAQLTGQLYHDHGKERWVSNMGGMEQVRIMRPDLGKLFMYMPQMNMAMEMPLGDDFQFGPPPADYDGPVPRAMGREQISGEATTMYRTEVNDPQDGLFVVTSWVTDDGIVMRMEGKGARGGFAMYLEGLARGPQDAALFELPPGAQLMPMNPALLDQFK